MTANLNANSAIIGFSSFIILATLGWIGTKTTENTSGMSRIEASLPFVNQAITDIKVQLSTLITRGEYEARVSALEKRISTLEDNLNHTSK